MKNHILKSFLRANLRPKKGIQKRVKTIKKTLKRYSSKLNKTVEKRPLTIFFGMLAAILIVSTIGTFLQQPEAEESLQVQTPKIVDTYTIGSAPRINVNATIEKSGVVTIVAQTSGVVQQVLCTEGEDFKHGNTLVQLSTNYQGGNALSVQRHIAATQYQNSTDTYDLQKEIIEKQRGIATNTDANNDELRDISEKSIDETRALIELNENNIDLINELIEITENASTPTTDSEKEKLSALKQQKSGLLNGLNAAKASLRQTEYSADSENKPARLSNLSKELTLQQLELQEKTLELNKEISLLQLRLAQINEALMFPAAPFSGRIERVHVRPGQVVNPGDPLVTISGNEQTLTAVAYVSKEIAQNISVIEESRVVVDGQSIALQPTYVSREATNGRQFTVLFHLPETLNDVLIDKEIISMDIPVGYADTTSAIPFIPLDAIYQTQDSAYVFVLDNGSAQSREVKLGNIFGSYVEITDGLQTEDVIILDRTVTQGTLVEPHI